MKKILLLISLFILGITYGQIKTLKEILLPHLNVMLVVNQILIIHRILLEILLVMLVNHLITIGKWNFKL